jgi:hypothetical protein
MSGPFGFPPAFKRGRTTPAQAGASLISDGRNLVEKITILPFTLEGDLFDTPENRVITSGWLPLP